MKPDTPVDVPARTRKLLKNLEKPVEIAPDEAYISISMNQRRSGN